MKLEDSVSREEFKAYKRVQNGGRHNMVMEADKAMRDANLDSETYWSIINNYEKLEKLYDEKADDDDLDTLMYGKYNEFRSPHTGLTYISYTSKNGTIRWVG